jgi:DNA-binding PadR family transcriptional regulator
VHIEKVNGRERKVYTLTEKGCQTFEVALEAWKEASSYVLQAGRATQKGMG